MRTFHAARILALASLLTVGPTSQAQPALFLSPDAHSITAGAAAALRTHERQDGKLAETPWPASIDWFFIRLAGTQENRSADDAPKPEADAPSVFRVPLAHAGIAMIGLDVPPVTTEWTSQQLSDFSTFTRKSPEHIAAPARVRRLQSAKTLIRVTDAAGTTAGDATATAKSGQAVEIRPLMDPTETPVGSDIALRVYIRGDAVGGATIIATHTPTGESRRARADAKGIAHFRVDRAGVWRIEFHDLRPLADDPDAAWLASSATLTFEIAVPKDGAK